MDEILKTIAAHNKGGTLGEGLRIPILADDVVLLKDNEVLMQLLLNDVSSFLERCGMAINPKKSNSISAAAVHGKSIGKTSFQGNRNLSSVYLGHIDISLLGAALQHQ